MFDNISNIDSLYEKYVDQKFHEHYELNRNDEYDHEDEEIMRRRHNKYDW